MNKLIANTLLGFALSFGAVTHVGAQDAEITGDADQGERVFRKCQACHAVGPDAKAKVGPVLNNILGSRAGEAEDFQYSDALLEQAESEELIWTPETLDAFLTRPRDYISGTKMSFAGLRKEEERQDVIAYLATFSE